MQSSLKERPHAKTKQMHRGRSTTESMQDQTSSSEVIGNRQAEIQVSVSTSRAYRTCIIGRRNGQYLTTKRARLWCWMYHFHRNEQCQLLPWTRLTIKSWRSDSIQTNGSNDTSTECARAKKRS